MQIVCHFIQGNSMPFIQVHICGLRYPTGILETIPRGYWRMTIFFIPLYRYRSHLLSLCFCLKEFCLLFLLVQVHCYWFVSAFLCCRKFICWPDLFLKYFRDTAQLSYCLHCFRWEMRCHPCLCSSICNISFFLWLLSMCSVHYSF